MKDVCSSNLFLTFFVLITEILISLCFQPETSPLEIRINWKLRIRKQRAKVIFITEKASWRMWLLICGQKGCLSIPCELDGLIPLVIDGPQHLQATQWGKPWLQDRERTSMVLFAGRLASRRASRKHWDQFPLLTHLLESHLFLMLNEVSGKWGREGKSHSSASPWKLKRQGIHVPL